MSSSRQANGPVHVTLAIPEHPRSMALIDGTVKPEGIHLTCIHEFKSAAERHGAMIQGKYDASEMNTFEYILIRYEGGNQLALPVFWVRGFRHGSVFCRKDSPVKKFSDLKGKSIGVTAFHSTGIVWSRGLLDDYGVTRDSVNWISAEKHSEPESAKVKFTTLNKNREVLWEMLEKGDIDAAVFPGNEGYYSFNPGGNLYQQIQKRGNFRTIQDDRQTIFQYYRKAGIYPIMHTVTVKADLAEQYPWVSRNLLLAFRKSRELAPMYETDREKEQSAEEIRFLGYDPYSYTLNDTDRKSMDTLMGYMVADGSLKKKLPVESLFAPEAI